MKKILFVTVLASVSLVAASSGKFTPIDGASLYKQKCSLCHGEQGRKVPVGASVLAGRDAVELALAIRGYRDQYEDVGAYTKTKESRVMYDQTSNLSNKQIGALAKYISTLK